MNLHFISQKTGAVLMIGPTKQIVAKIRKALHLIHRVDPREYQRVNVRMRVIFVTRKQGFTNEFFMPERMWFTNVSMILKNDVVWIASLIVHEAFHATQFKHGGYIAPLIALEPPALKVQERFLKRTGDPTSGTTTRNVRRQRYWTSMRRDTQSAAHFRHLLTLFGQKHLTIKPL